MKLHELRESRAAAVARMRTLAETEDREKRALTAEEDKTFSDLKAEIKTLDGQIGRAEALAEAERAAPAIVARVGDGQYESRAREFSLTKMMRSVLPGGIAEDTGLEREISTEVIRRSGRKFEGIAVPDEIFRVERRTLLVGSSAADLVPSPHLAAQFIDVLRARLVCARLGATYLDGLVGSPIDIPKQTGSSTGQWVAEDASLTETDLAVDSVTFEPKTVGAMTSYSRRTLLNASPSIEQLVRNDLAAVIASAVDAQAMIGDGSGNTPTGIINAGAAEITATALTWADVLSFISTIDASNALEGSLSWAINPYVVAMLRKAVVVASTDSRMIMADPNSLAGYAAVSSSALPGSKPGAPAVAGTVIFGDWSSLLIGSWTGVDLLLNPFETTAYAKGRVMVRAMKDMDVQVRHAESFAFDNSIVTA